MTTTAAEPRGIPCPRLAIGCAYSKERRARIPTMKPLVDTKVLNPAQTAVALGLITEMDFLRLKAIARLHARGLPRDVDLYDPASDPERALSARQELKLIERLFAEDTVALQIIAGIGKGLSAEHIRSAAHLSKRDYDSARKRIRRTLLREGLTHASTR